MFAPYIIKEENYMGDVKAIFGQMIKAAKENPENADILAQRICASLGRK